MPVPPALVDLPDRRLTDDEIAIFVPIAILRSQFNPGLNQPFAPHVGEFLARLGINQRERQAFQVANGDLDQRLAEYCWRLTVLGYLVPRVSGDWGTFHLTDKGRQLLTSVDPAMLAAGGLDSKLQEAGFADDDLVRQYARLAHECFLSMHHETSIVMLGVASEVLVVGLAEAVDKLFVPGVAKRKARSSASQDLGLLESALKTHDRALRQALPAGGGAWIEPLSKLLSGTGQVLRMSRNELGHPTGLRANQTDALELFTLFPRFAVQAKRALDELPK